MIAERKKKITQDKRSKPNANQGNFIPSLALLWKKVFCENVPNANSHTVMAANLVVFEPSTPCACAQVLWQQRSLLKSISTHQLTTQKFTFPKYGHCDANGSHFRFWRRGTAVQKGQPSSFRLLVRFIAYVTELTRCLLQTVYWS